MMEAGNDHFVIYGMSGRDQGRHLPEHRRWEVQLYRKVKVTKNNGRFRTRVYQYKNLRTCFRVVVPATPSTYDQLIVPVGCIVTPRKTSAASTYDGPTPARRCGAVRMSGSDRQMTVQVSPPPMRPASRSVGVPVTASRAVATWARAWSSYVARSTWRKMPIGDWLR